jgi:hypothetical protein
LCVIDYFEIGCPILYFFNIECPTCGVTRALIALFELDFNGYIKYHPLAIPLLVAVWVFFHGKIIKRKKAAYFIAGVILFLNSLLYVIRLTSIY